MLSPPPSPASRVPVGASTVLGETSASQPTPKTQPRLRWSDANQPIEKRVSASSHEDWIHECHS